jgi:hypothetical protein
MRWREMDVRRENTDVRWVGFHPLQTLRVIIDREKSFIKIDTRYNRLLAMSASVKGLKI